MVFGNSTQIVASTLDHATKSEELFEDSILNPAPSSCEPACSIHAPQAMTKMGIISTKSKAAYIAKNAPPGVYPSGHKKVPFYLFSVIWENANYFHTGLIPNLVTNKALQ